jgi:hypothetical protein
MNQAITCPIVVGGRECGRQELLERKIPLGRLPGSTHQIVHQECGVHKFHIQFPKSECMRLAQ